MDIMVKVLPFVLGILLLRQVVGLCMYGHTYIGALKLLCMYMYFVHLMPVVSSLKLPSYFCS